MQLKAGYIGEKKVPMHLRIFFCKFYLKLDTKFNKWKSNISSHFCSVSNTSET